MPDHQWKCGQCGEKNPAFTEVCRNCLSSVIAGDPPTSRENTCSTIRKPFFDTSVFRSFKYQSLEEVSQETFEIVSEFKPIRWLIFPVFFVLAVLMVNSAIETFQTGQTYAKGGRLLTGQVAYLHAVFGAYATLVLPFMAFRGPKWFSIFKRSLMVGLLFIFVWSLTAQLSMAA